MLPLSRPLFDHQAAQALTLCVVGALVAGTVAVIAMLAA
jgi:hypothetical protein